MTLSLSILLTIIMVLMIVKWELSKFGAFICVLLGISIANTPVGDGIMNGAESVVEFLNNLGQ